MQKDRAGVSKPGFGKSLGTPGIQEQRERNSTSYFSHIWATGYPVQISGDGSHAGQNLNDSLTSFLYLHQKLPFNILLINLTTLGFITPNYPHLNPNLMCMMLDNTAELTKSELIQY